MRASAAPFYLGVDGPSDDVARQEVRRAPGFRRAARGALPEPLIGLVFRARGLVRVELGDVPEHDPLSVLVAERSTLAANAFRDERTADARGPDHSRGVKLHELHVHQLGASEVSKRLPVARALPGIRVDAKAAADAARCEHDGFGSKNDEAPGIAPIAEGSARALAIGEQPRDRALHVHLHPAVDAMLLERPDHLEARPVTHVRETRILVAPEIALKNASVGGAV